MTKTDWNPLLRDQFEQPYWDDLQAFVAAERAAHVVYPPPADVYAALHLTSCADTLPLPWFGDKPWTSLEP